MKRIYKIIIWLASIGVFLWLYFGIIRNYLEFLVGYELLINLLILNVIAYFLRSLFINLTHAFIKKLFARYIIKIILNITWLIFPFWLIFIISPIYFVAIISFLVVAISLTFQSIINNIISGIMLLSSEGFEAGDLIETNGVEGIVKDITLNYVKLEDFDGSLTYIPNKTAFNSSIVRYTHKPTKEGIKFSITDVIKTISKILVKEEKITRYRKVVELLISVDVEKLDELLKPVFEKYEVIFGIKPYFYANNTVMGVTSRLSITIQILSKDPKLILTYTDPLMKDILFKIYDKEINYQWNSSNKTVEVD
ncbi:MAG: mechanosensitive ion channel domain-containing protein [Candidatus Hodarchaeota archaeon]